MASITKHQNGWRAHVDKRGIRKSRLFKSKTAANDWARRLEIEIVDGLHNTSKNKSVADLLERYRDNVTTLKRSCAWETNKINHILKMPIAKIRLDSLSAPKMVEWRDGRLNEVSNGTVNREWNLLNSVFNTAIKEWEWLNKNPLVAIKRPSQPAPRDRLISPAEIELIEHTTGYIDCPATISSRIGAAFLFAIETAMRAGEIVSIKPDRVNLENQTCFLPVTKNGSSRTVPLSNKAVEILKKVNCDFNLTSRQVDSIFRKARKMANIENLHFHDTRHQAITNLAQKIQVLDLARMVGIKDLKILMVYYNETAESIAKKLD